MRVWTGLVIALALAAGPVVAHAPSPAASGPVAQAYPGVIDIELDARDVARGVYRIKQRIPVVAPGPMTLLFPEWLPGNHAPRGALARYAGLTITATGQAVPWRRDPINVFAFHVDAPEGAGALEIEAQFVTATEAAQGRVQTSPAMLHVQWNNGALYPAGYAVAGIRVRPTLILPEGWAFASALSPQTGAAGAGPVRFAETDLETLVDSPLYAGRHATAIELDPGGAVPVVLNVFGDTPELIAANERQIAAHRKFVREADALFGGRPFERYDFLLALSSELSRIGLEHHRSSENAPGAKYFTAPRDHLDDYDLLPHEYVHAWNGKYRRPAGLATGGFDAPMQNDLLWVYEGQTQFWGQVLAARAGLWSQEETLDALAFNLGSMNLRTGRAWRSLQDTVYEPIISARAPQPWTSWQRPEDYYVEGLLIWLEADQLIRERSRNRRSLDDFARAFFATDAARAIVKPYDFEEIVATMNAVEPYDWAGFFRARLDATGAPAPSGFERGGWRVVASDTANAFLRGIERGGKQAWFAFSLGFNVGEGGRVTAVIWDGLAFTQGLTVGDQIVAVNGQSYEAGRLEAAILAAKAEPAPIEVLIKSGDRYRTLAFDYRSGLRHPKLERIAGQPDRLSAMLAPRTR